MIGEDVGEPPGQRVRDGEGSVRRDPLRVALLVVLALVAPSKPANAGPDGDPPFEAPVAEGLAGNALAAWRAKDAKALGSIANGSEASPWEIADELLALGQPAAARALAAALLEPVERVELGSWLKGAVSGETETALRDAFRKAQHAADAARLTTLLGPALGPTPSKVLPPSILLARAANLLASSLEAEGAEPRPTESAWTECIAAARAVGWSRLELSATHRLVIQWDGAGRIEDAANALDEVMPLRQGRSAWEEIGDLLLDRGAMYAKTGRWGEARGHFRDAAASFRAAALPGGEARALAHLAAALLDGGNLVEALTVLEDAEPLVPVDDVPLRATVLRRRSAVFEAAGMLPKARELLDEATRILRNSQELTPARAAGLLGDQGRVAFLARELVEARSRFEECERLYADLGVQQRVVQALCHQAWVEAEGHPRPELMRRLRELLEPGAPDLSTEDRIIVSEALARCLRAANDAPGAVKALKAVVSNLSDLEADSTLRTDILGALGSAHAAAGNHDEAAPVLDAFVERLVGRVDTLELAVARTYQGIVADEALTAAVVGASATADMGRLWRYLEASRAVRLLASLGGRTKLDEVLVPEGLRTKLSQARAEYEAARREEALARRPGSAATMADLSRIGKLQRDAADRRDAVGEAVKLARAKNDLIELSGGARLLGLREAQAALAKDGSEAVLQLSLRAPGDHVLAMLVQRTSPPVVALLRGRAALLRAARDLQGATAPRDVAPGGTGMLPRTHGDKPDAALSPTQALHRLKELLVSSLAVPGDVRTLHVVPEGALAYVPYGAVFDTRDVAILPAASLLPHVHSLQRRSGRDALALGISDYSTAALVQESAALQSLSPGVRGGSSVAGLRRLEHAAREARLIAGERGVPLIDGQATAKELIDLLASRPETTWSTIHFACHGLLDPDFPTLSGLALHDGVLTSQEVFPLRLRTDMVVLSACSTSRDPYVVGEGVSGLVRAFLQTGAARVIASLWAVPDEPTSALMVEFYRLLNSDPSLAPASALRRAQAHVRSINGGRWSSPENWAGWVLWGAS